MARLSAVISLAVLWAVASATAGEPVPDAPVHIRATVELTDGSRLIGTPAGVTLSLTLDYAHLEIPLERIRRWDTITPAGKPVGEKDRPASTSTVAVQRTNGDRFTGTFDLPQLQLDTILGPITPNLKFVRSGSYAPWREGDMPPGDGDLAFCGLRWLTWRTEFAIEGDRLRSLPKARPGFQYGHEGHGEAARCSSQNLATRNCLTRQLDFRYCVTGVDPSFNPYGLGNDYRDEPCDSVPHRRREGKPERSRQQLLHPRSPRRRVVGVGRAVYNQFCDQPIGWGNPRGDADRTLAHGTGLALDRQNGNRIRIDYGNRIHVWVDDASLLDVLDNQMADQIGGQRLDHGGVGFVGGFDAMFWIKDVSVRSRPSEMTASVRTTDERGLPTSFPGDCFWH